MKTQQEIRDSGSLLFESIRGSHLYGLQTETSDIDTYGVFIGPLEWFLGMGLDKQVSIMSEKCDDSWNEVDKYFRELSRSNPDALCSLFTPESLVKVFNPVLQPLWDIKDSLLTKECFAPFSSYSLSQIKKAKGLKKAINIDPKEVKRRKSVLEFCHVPVKSGIVSLDKWLGDRGMENEKCGVSRLPKGIETFALYYDESGKIGYRGVCKDNSNEIRLSSIPKDQADSPTCYFQFNSNAYSRHCSDYKRYWNWVKNRNQERFNLNKGYDFDAKNMSHCVRLMTMAKEIAEGKGMLLDRSEIDRKWLLEIKNHKVPYDELMKYVESLEKEMLESFRVSTIPDRPDIEKLDEILINLRTEMYGR